jgi:hypothetical protein
MARLAASDYQIISSASLRRATVLRFVPLRCALSDQSRAPGVAPKIAALAGRSPAAQILWRVMHPYRARDRRRGA